MLIGTLLSFKIWAPAWFGVREKINWSSLKAYPSLCESALAAIERNKLDGDDVNCFTNELAERVFRMVQEKLSHNKSFSQLEQNVITYFNDDSARLNNST